MLANDFLGEVGGGEGRMLGQHQLTFHHDFFERVFSGVGHSGESGAKQPRREQQGTHPVS